MNRTQMTLAGLLGLQVILIVLVAGPFHASTTAPEAHPLLPDLEGFQPTKVEVDGPGEEQVTLVKKGTDWTIEQAGGYPADASKVEKLLDSLKEIEVRRPVVTSSRYHSALKVTKDDHERELRMWSDPDGDPEVALYMGTSSNYRSTNVRLEGDDPVYEVSGLGIYDVRNTANGWIQSRFLEDVKPEEVTGLRIQNAHGTFEVKKEADGTWTRVTPASGGGDLDSSKIDSLIRSATGLNVAEPAGTVDRAAQGLEKPQSTVVLKVGGLPPPAAEGEQPAEGAEPVTSEPEREVTLWIGSPVPTDDGRLYVARADFGFAAEIYKGSAQRFLDQKVADLE